MLQLMWEQHVPRLILGDPFSAHAHTVLVTDNHPAVAQRKKMVSRGSWSNPIPHECPPRARKKPSHLTSVCKKRGRSSPR